MAIRFLQLQLQFYLKRAAGESENRVIIPLDRSVIYILSLTSFRLNSVFFFFFCTHTEVLVMIISDQFLCLTITALMMTYKLGLH